MGIALYWEGVGFIQRRIQAGGCLAGRYGCESILEDILCYRRLSGLMDSILHWCSVIS